MVDTSYGSLLRCFIATDPPIVRSAFICQLKIGIGHQVPLRPGDQNPSFSMLVVGGCCWELVDATIPVGNH